MVAQEIVTCLIIMRNDYRREFVGYLTSRLLEKPRDARHLGIYRYHLSMKRVKAQAYADNYDYTPCCNCNVSRSMFAGPLAFKFSHDLQSVFCLWGWHMRPFHGSPQNVACVGDYVSHCRSSNPVAAANWVVWVAKNLHWQTHGYRQWTSAVWDQLAYE